MEKIADLQFYEAILRPGEQSTGRVTHHYGPSLTIAEVHPGYVPMTEEEVDQLEAGLDRVGQLGLAAFRHRQSEAFRKSKEARRHDGVAWNDKTIPGLQTPVGIDQNPFPDYTGTPTSSQLQGTVAVGIVIVSGPGALAFTQAEQDNVMTQVQHGLSWLGTATGTPVHFQYDFPNIVQLTLPDDPSGPNKERYWLEPTMEILGYDNPLDYVLALRSQLSTDWAYCAFFVKYSLKHFAYAYRGGPFLCMDYANDDWHPENIDRVFAHETGHIFNAPDEYDPCTCTATFGYYNVENGNCHPCAPDGGVPCLMYKNSFEMCDYTPWHVGCIIPAILWNQGMGQGEGYKDWLIGDVDNDGMDEVIQLWGPDWLGMIVYGWSDGMMKTLWSGNMNQGSNAIKYLIGDIDKDLQAEIIQLWSNNSKLSMIVYGWDGTAMTTVWSGDMNETTDAIEWLIGDINHDGKQEIIQLYENNGELGILIYQWSGTAMTLLWGSDELSENYIESNFVIGDLNRDGQAEIIQTWNNDGQLGMAVYGWSGTAMPLLWSNDQMNEPPEAEAWLIGDVNKDLKAELIQTYDNNGQLGMIVYGWNGTEMEALWSNSIMNDEVDAMDWLVGDVNKDGQMEIVQLQNNGGWLGIVAYGWENGAMTTIPYGYKNMGQGSGAEAWLIGDINGLGYADIVQPWADGSNLGMIIYGRVRY